MQASLREGGWESVREGGQACIGLEWVCAPGAGCAHLEHVLCIWSTCGTSGVSGGNLEWARHTWSGWGTPEVCGEHGENMWHLGHTWKTWVVCRWSMDAGVPGFRELCEGGMSVGGPDASMGGPDVCVRWVGG